MLFKKILREKKVYMFMFAMALFLGCLPTNAKAMPVDSKAESSKLAKSYQNDLETVSEFLEEGTIAKKLSKLGLSKDQIKSRLDSLDRHQIHCLAMRIESIEKAGDSGGIAIAILAILLIFISYLYFTRRRVKIEREYD